MSRKEATRSARRRVLVQLVAQPGLLWARRGRLGHRQAARPGSPPGVECREATRSGSWSRGVGPQSDARPVDVGLRRVRRRPPLVGRPVLGHPQFRRAGLLGHQWSRRPGGDGCSEPECRRPVRDVRRRVRRKRPRRGGERRRKHRRHVLLARLPDHPGVRRPSRPRSVRLVPHRRQRQQHPGADDEPHGGRGRRQRHQRSLPEAGPLLFPPPGHLQGPHRRGVAHAGERQHDAPSRAEPTRRPIAASSAATSSRC